MAKVVKLSDEIDTALEEETETAEDSLAEIAEEEAEESDELDADEEEAGEGLDDLDSNVSSPVKAAPKADATQVIKIPLKKLILGSLDRSADDLRKVDDLKGSIKAHGLINPIVVSAPDAEGKYWVVSGKRRTVAYKQLGKTEIPAIVLPKMTDDQRTVLLFADNYFRRDVPKETQAEIMKGLLSSGTYKTQTELAEAFGMGQSTVSNLLRYAELPAEVRAEVKASNVGELPAGTTPEQAKALVEQKRFKVVPQDVLKVNDGGEPVTFRLAVSKTQIRLVFNFKGAHIKQKGIATFLHDEIKRVGDEELIGFIRKWRAEAVNPTPKAKKAPAAKGKRGRPRKVLTPVVAEALVEQSGNDLE